MERDVKLGREAAIRCLLTSPSLSSPLIFSSFAIFVYPIFRTSSRLFSLDAADSFDALSLVFVAPKGKPLAPSTSPVPLALSALRRGK